MCLTAGQSPETWPCEPCVVLSRSKFWELGCDSYCNGSARDLFKCIPVSKVVGQGTEVVCVAGTCYIRLALKVGQPQHTFLEQQEG